MGIQAAVKSLFWDDHIQKDRPVAVFGNFNDYQAVAHQLSSVADKTLVWALHGTPIAKSASLTKGLLTDADANFGSYTCPKVRIVVFEYWRQLSWYIKARAVANGEAAKSLLFRKKLEAAAERVRAFEASVTSSGSNGKLLFTATDIIDQRLREYRQTKLDAGYVCSGDTVYCFHSKLSLKDNMTASKLHPEKIMIFKLSNTIHEELPARPFYYEVFDQISKHPGGDQMFFDSPEEVLDNVRKWGLWQLKRSYEKMSNWLAEKGSWLARNRKTVKGIITLLFWLFVLGSILFQVLGLIKRAPVICPYACPVELAEPSAEAKSNASPSKLAPPSTAQPKAADGRSKQ